MRRRIDQHGAVLIVVLWVVSLLTLLLGAFTGTVRIEQRLAADTASRAQGRAAAEAVLHYLAAVHRVGGDLWAGMPGQVFVLPFMDQHIRFRLLPEEAFLSLNGASAEQLLILMSGVAPDEPGRDTWLEQVMRRREGGVDEQGNMSAPQPWLSVAELIQLPGVSREVIDRLMPHLTVDSVHLGVDFRYASRALLTLLLGESAAQGVIEERAQSGDMPLGSGGPADMHTTITSGIYRIQVELAHAGRVRQLEATARFGESAAGYQLIRWNDYTARFALDGY